jgi:subtilisin family serine protease
MGWVRKTHPPGPRRRCWAIESLEVRTLLSAIPSPWRPLTLDAPPRLAQTDTSNPSGIVAWDALDRASQARAQYNVDGTGFTAAVIDTGVNYRNEALGGYMGPNAKVDAGYDFADNSPNPMATTMQHGTAVAGLIASDDPNDPGVAPGANIAALRVFDVNGQSSFVYIANALQWVIDHHQQDNITVVNLSISDGGNYAANWFANDGGIGQRITSLIHQLDLLNIPVVAAAGNSFDGTDQGMGFPAIDPETISVTATDGAGHLASDAQRLGSALGGAAATTIAAPGVNLLAPADGQTFTTVTGTSFAAPQVTGAILLLQQVYEDRFGQLPTVAQLKSWLQNGSDPITDPATGTTIGQLDILKALSLVPNPQPQIVNPAAPTSSPPAPGPVNNPKPEPAPAPAPTATPVASPTPAPSSPGTSVSQAPAASLVATPSPPPTPSQPPSAPQPAPVPAPSQTPALQLYIDGQAEGPLSATASSDSWSSVFSVFSGLGSFNTVQVWTSVPATTTGGSPSPQGELGNTVRIRARLGSLHAVIGQERAHALAQLQPTPTPRADDWQRPFFSRFARGPRGR